MAEPRAQLAAAQAEFVAALLRRGPAPASFDIDRLTAAADALQRKRRRELVHAWPSLADAALLHFDAYARATPLPQHGGPLADGYALQRWLITIDACPERARWQALAVDLRWRACVDGLARRRGPALRVAWLRSPRRLVLACRLPWVGAWWLSIPFALGRGF